MPSASCVEYFTSITFELEPCSHQSRLRLRHLSIGHLRPGQALQEILLAQHLTLLQRQRPFALRIRLPRTGLQLGQIGL